MADKDNHKYYWLKLDKDFFKRHDIRVIESMPNGKDYILFYLKLLCESVSHNGELRFSETIPYNEQMLSTITYTNVDIVKSACSIFSQLGMMTILEDGTYYFEQVSKMIGSITGGALRKQEYRDRKGDNGGTMVGQCPLDKDIEIDIEKDKDKDIYYYNNLIDKKEKNIVKREKEDGGVFDSRFTPPTLEQVKVACEGNAPDIDPEQFYYFYQSKGWKVGNDYIVDWLSKLKQWQLKKMAKNNEEDRARYPKANHFEQTRVFSKEQVEEINKGDDLDDIKGRI